VAGSSPDSPFAVAAVLFDLDGTLVHAPIDFGRMKREVLAEVEAAGLNPDPFRRFDLLRIIDAAEDAGAGPDLRKRCEARLAAIEEEAAGAATVADGAFELLAWLGAAGVRVGIVTRNSPEAVAGVLRRFPLPHHVLLTRADTPRVKPDPLHLLLALERLGALPHQAVMVGDHRMDIQAGKAAGTATIGVLLPEHPPDFFHEAAPDLVIRALPELRRWISPLSS
jgi:phosphoglycolate phosphatase